MSYKNHISETYIVKDYLIPIHFNRDDDSFGEDVGIMIDDEPDEVQAAYEEFLKMSSKK